MENNLVNLSGLSRRVRLPAGWLKSQAAAGRLPCLRVGRKLRFNVAAVEKALADMAAERREAEHVS